jgi:hypothetical protein
MTKGKGRNSAMAGEAGLTATPCKFADLLE